MGATTFESYSALEDVKAAFSDCVDTAAWNYGHAGYTGTIAEKDSYVVIQMERLPYDEAERLAHQLIDDGDERIDDKWGPAGAIPVVTPDGVKGWLFFGWASC